MTDFLKMKQLLATFAPSLFPQCPFALRQAGCVTLGKTLALSLLPMCEVRQLVEIPGCFQATGGIIFGAGPYPLQKKPRAK